MDTPLTAERLRDILDYNPETGQFTWKIGFRGYLPNRPAGFLTTQGYWAIGYRGKPYLAHRLAWLYTHGKWPENVLDHINRNTLDNRLSNLREATQRQNCQNTKRVPKGCYKQGNRYYSRIRVEGGTLSLGGFSTEEEATDAYQKARQRLHSHYVE